MYYSVPYSRVWGSQTLQFGKLCQCDERAKISREVVSFQVPAHGQRMARSKVRGRRRFVEHRRFRSSTHRCEAWDNEGNTQGCLSFIQFTDYCTLTSTQLTGN